MKNVDRRNLDRVAEILNKDLPVATVLHITPEMIKQGLHDSRVLRARAFNRVLKRLSKGLGIA